MKCCFASSIATALFVVAATVPASATPFLWISDDLGNIGELDIASGSVVAGSVHNTGVQLTDIAFDAGGNLYGTSFTALYALDRTNGGATALGSYGNGAHNSVAALVGDGANLLLGSG